MELKSDLIIPAPTELKEWETEFFDEDENFDVMLVKAYQAGYWRCQGEYEFAAMSAIVPPTDLEVDDED